jgi:hypothetical protein
MRPNIAYVCEMDRCSTSSQVAACDTKEKHWQDTVWARSCFANTTHARAFYSSFRVFRLFYVVLTQLVVHFFFVGGQRQVERHMLDGDSGGLVCVVLYWLLLRSEMSEKYWRLHCNLPGTTG